MPLKRNITFIRIVIISVEKVPTSGLYYMLSVYKDSCFLFYYQWTVQELNTSYAGTLYAHTNRSPPLKRLLTVKLQKITLSSTFKSSLGNWNIKIKSHKYLKFFKWITSNTYGSLLFIFKILYINMEYKVILFQMSSRGNWILIKKSFL